MPDPHQDTSPRARPVRAPLARVHPRTAAVATWAAVSALLLVAWAITVVSLNADAREDRQILADQTALRLQDWIASRMLVLSSIRAIRAQGLLATPDEWRQRMAADMQTIGGFQAINWIDDDGVIAITAPAEGNEGALGKSVRAHPVAGPVFARAEATRTAQVSPPLDLFQGGRAFTTYVPITTTTGEPAGYLNGVFRVDRIVDHALSDIDPADLVVAISDQDQPVWGSADRDLAQGDAGVGSLSVGDRTWTLAIHPAHPQVPPPVHLLAVVAALVVGGIAGMGAATATQQAREAADAREEAARIARHVEELERMESLGRVAGGIAHDFNNILSVVVGRASMLELQLDDRPQAKADVEAILDAGERAAELIETLLTFSRRKEEGAGSVDAAQHLAQLEPLLRHVAGRKVAYSQQIAVASAPVPLVPAALDRVVINLVSNAQQAINGTGGHIDLTLGADRSGFCLTVRDDGKGMTAETRARIFEPFFTTRETGTGLGLATVFGLVTDVGGSFDVVSAPGEGTRFSVHLPGVGSQRADTPSA